MGYWTISIDLGMSLLFLLGTFKYNSCFPPNFTGLLFGPLIGSFAALVSADFVAWLSAIIFGVLLCFMLLFLDETAYDRNNVKESEDEDKSSIEDSNTPLPWLNFWKTNTHGLQHTPMLETTLHVLKLLTYPTVAIPVIVFSWTWYLVSCAKTIRFREPPAHHRLRFKQWIMCVITMLPAAYPTWQPQIQGLLVIGMIIGTITAEVTCSGALSDALVDCLSGGIASQRKPEMRLWLLIPAILATSLGLTLFALSTQRGWHWAVTQVGSGFVAFGIQAGNTVVSTYVVDCYPQHVMSIIAFYSVHLNLSAFASPFWIVPQVSDPRWGWGWAFGSEAIIVVVFGALFIPGMLIWGDKLRLWRGPLVWQKTSSHS